MRDSSRIILVAALTLDLGFLGFRLSTGRGLGVGMMALALGLMLPVGAWIVYQQRTGTEEMGLLVSRTNTSLRALAERAGLKYEPPPEQSGSPLQGRPFGEARGTCRGIYVRIAVESYASEDLFLAMLFPKASLARDATKQVRALVDHVRNDDEQVQLYLGKSPPWFSNLSLNPIPETDVERLTRVLEVACQLLGSAGPTPPAPPR